MDEMIGEIAVEERPTPAATWSAPDLDRYGRNAWSLIGIGLATAGAVWVVSRFLVVIVPVVVAVLMTTILWPAARWLRRHGFPPLAATWVVLGGALAVLAGALAWIVPTIADQAASLRSSVGGGVTRIEDWLVTGPFGLSRGRVDTWSTDLRDQFGSFESQVAKGALAQTPLVLEIVGGIVLAAVLVFFFLQDGPDWHRRLRLADDSPLRHRIDGIWRALSGFSRGLVVNAAVNAIVLGVALAILGVPLAAPIAAITFVASFVPIVGAIVSGGVASLVALVAVGPGTALIIVAVTIAIHHLEAYVVGPRVIGRGTGLHPVVLILALVVGISLAGIPGGFLAGPFAAAASGWFTGGLRNRRE
jgi:predicted PurR-regulated permease PerM